MNKTAHILILLGLIAIQPSAFGFTVVSEPGIGSSQSQGAVTRFNLEGTITGWNLKKGYIYINKRPYSFSQLSGIQPGEMSKGSKVFYNLEKSSTKDRGTVTKIWLKGEHE